MVRPLPRHQVIDDQSGAKNPPGYVVALQAGVKKTQPVDQPASLPEQVFALGDRFEGDAHLGIFQVTHPAVDQF